MSDQDTSSAEKEHEASPQKLVEARKKGDIPRSADLLAAASLAGFVLAILWLGGGFIDRLGTTGAVLLDQSDRLAPLVSGGGTAQMAGILAAFVLPFFLLMLFPLMAVIAALFAIRGFVVAPDNLAPKLSRISPISVARHKFGPEGLAEFAKGLVKLGLVSTVLYLFFAARLPEMLGLVHLSATLSVAVMGRMVVEFMGLVLVLSLVIAGVDYLWQVHLHRQRNRMSRKELLDEFKESEGDPHLRAARRRRAEDVATNRMLADVAMADVVVVNPTHYAVALRWDRAGGTAPICVAKGVDEIARVIRERAAEHDVPIHNDPPTARALHATIDIGQPIRIEHYRAVAGAIRFADTMRRKARRQ